jgi:hypothetical protein
LNIFADTRSAPVLPERFAAAVTGSQVSPTRSFGMSRLQRLISVLAVSAAAWLSWPGYGQAQNARSDGDNNRFTIEQTLDGFLRLDRRTGEMSFCRVKESGLSCTATAEERAAWEAEISRLADRIARIEKELAALGAGGSLQDDRQLAVPDNERQDDTDGDAQAELDRALDLAEKAWLRFAEMIRQLKDELASRNLGK